MFNWLFEERVKGTLFFETSWKERHLASWPRLMEVMEIVSRHESVKEYIDFKLMKRTSMKLLSNVALQYNCNIFDWNEEKPFYWRIEVDCWEGAWKELEKLPWATGTAKAL